MKKKKGFTLVELLVVIAILAVLATVSVVGYMGFTKKAKESNDASLTTQMNTALQANGVVKKNKTLTEAREDLLEAGIDLEKVTPTTDGYSYVWDSKQDLMFLLNENRDVVAPTNATISANTVDSFVVVHNEAEFNTWKSDYSLYFANGYENPSIELTNKLVGIDAGTSGINNISVKDDSSTADVTMYTTSGTLTIDARQATVRHYGEAKNVSIIAIAGKSYHEYGTVTGNVEVEDGHVVVENTANVSTIVAKPTNNSTVKVTATNENNVGTIVTTNTSKTTFDVPESVKPTENITDDKLSEMNDFAGGLGTEKSPYLIENAEQFTNIGKYSDQMKTGKSFSFKLINNIDLSSLSFDNKYVSNYFSGNFNGENYELIVNNSLEGIFGSAVNNCKFENVKLKLFTNAVKLCEGVYVNTGANINFTNIDISSKLNDEFVKIGKNEGIFFNVVGFDSVNNEWSDNHRTKLVISNCLSSVNISAESYNAVFIGGMLNNADVIVRDSSYSGQYYGEKINLVYGNTCSDSGDGWNNYRKSTMTIENVHNIGAMYGTERAALIAGGDGKEEAKSHTTISNCSLGTTRALTDSGLAIQKNELGKLIITKAIADTNCYVLTFVGGIRRVGEYTENSSYRFSIKLDNIAFTENGAYVTDYKFGKMVTLEQYKEINKNTKISIGSGLSLYNDEETKYWVEEYENEVYYIFSFKDTYYHFESSKGVSGPSNINTALITIYDSDNKPIAQKNCKA